MDRNDDLRDDTARDDSAANAASSDTSHIFHHDDRPSAGDIVGEGIGGVSGVLAGAALGSLGGPIGTIIGGIAGAVGGWWTGRTVSEAAAHMSGQDTDTHYRSHYESSPDRPADRSYEDVRPAYQIGHLAGRNPDYSSRSFDDVEGDLQRGWTGDVSARHGDWQSVRGYARDAYERSRSSVSPAGATATDRPGRPG